MDANTPLPLPTCGAFLKRVWPGRNITCANPALWEIWAINKNGKQISHGRYCRLHAEARSHGYAIEGGEWSIEIRCSDTSTTTQVLADDSPH